MKHDAARLGVFLTHRSALIDYAAPIVGDRHQAEDVVQEAFLRFSSGGAATIDQPAAYLYRIVRNLALDWTRRRGLERRQETEPEWWMTPRPARDPAAELAHRRNLERIAAGLSGLSPQARLALEMHRFGGFPLREVAQKLGVSVPTAHRLVRDALVAIAHTLED